MGHTCAAVMLVILVVSGNKYFKVLCSVKKKKKKLSNGGLAFFFFFSKHAKVFELLTLKYSLQIQCTGMIVCSEILNKTDLSLVDSRCSAVTLCK